MADTTENSPGLHYETPVVDAHCDTLAKITSRNTDIGLNLPSCHIDLAKLERGGVDLQVFAAFVHPITPGKRYFEKASSMSEKLRETCEKYSSRIVSVKDKCSLKYAIENHVIGAIFGLEGAHSLQGSFDNLYSLYDQGMRILTLTWNNTNEFADSSATKPVHDGLSEEGKKLLKELNQLGIVPDLSHSSAKVLEDVAKMSRRPFIASHSNAASLCPVFRNLTDEQLKIIADTGSVVGINFYPLFLDQKVADKFEKADARRKVRFNEINRSMHYADPAVRKLKRNLIKEMLDSLPSVSYTRIVDHIEYIISVAGEDHVGLGSDFDGIPFTPDGMEDVTKLPLLTSEMIRRGWDERRIKKVLGLNMLRVLEETLS